ncbi:hypothetical protein [Moritella sp. F3]|uniref:hypothetical protein n=1 Tax=Moritella sp. F3 TaxID=2718882 RepID=UPI0018E157B5|nr:hypothetical protein [Moritella sp. F3]GIC77115.1 hypothetical protein FMO001_18420 [Moritella sp. F1]GIC82234.1 hypothetical protein FMO003_25150 [Moritella sp. F3]
MPKINTYNFEIKNNAGDKIEFESDLFVDQNGMFAVVFPDEYVLHIRANLLKGCRVTKPRKYMRVESKSLDDAIKSIDDGIKSLLETEESHELIIRYKYETQCHYAKHIENGKLYSNCAQGMRDNGQHSDAGGRIVNWVDNGADNRSGRPVEPYTITIQAQVLRKTTYKSRNHERVEYFHTSKPYNDEISCEEKPHLGEFGEKLNGFNGTRLTLGSEEVSYSEDAAQFFHDAMMAICGLSDRLTGFFSEKSNVMDAIENKTNLLPVLPTK